MVNKPGAMITFKQYGDRYAINKGMTCFEDVYRMGLIADEIEEFTKGYARLACEAQRDKCNDMHNHAIDIEYPYSISDTPLIELK